MKKTFIIMVLLALSLICCTIWAQELNTQGLSPSQKAELIIQAEKMKTKPEAETPVLAPPPPTVDTVAKWAEAGKSLAVGLGAGAREIGVAVNEFSESRVGRITTYIIVWKLMGKEILAILTSIILLSAIYPWWKVLRSTTVKNAEYEYYDTWYRKGVKRLKKIEYLEDEGSLVGMYCVFALGSLVLFISAIKVLPF
jgi:hypothetical protein